MSEPMLPSRGQLTLDCPGIDDVTGDPDRDTWCTPKFLTDAIGEVDLDPCSNERSHVQARRTFRLDRGQDGLVLAKFVNRQDVVFINPPYSRGQVIRWVRAYEHARFIFLVRMDTSTEWFLELERRSAAICCPRERRINFEPPPGASAGSNAFPHGLFYAREDDISAEMRRMCYLWRPVRP